MNHLLCGNGQISNPQLQLKPEVPAWNFFVPLRSIEMEADHRDNMDNTTERQQYQTPAIK
jgi:hypothetical protein